MEPSFATYPSMKTQLESTLPLPLPGAYVERVSDIWDRFLIVAIFVGMFGLAYAALATPLLQPIVDLARRHHWSGFWVRPTVIWIAMGFLLMFVRTLLWLRYRPFAPASFNEAPRLTVVIPAYNEGEMVEDSIASVAAANYPKDRLQIIAIDDGSKDDTWRYIERAAQRYPGLVTPIRLAQNRGKRGALAEGFRRATGEVIITVDSDSIIDGETLLAIAGPFRDERVGAVVGHADVANRWVNWLTKMQQVRYYAAFHVIKGTESLLSGTVTCASGCCSAYRREVILPELPGWETQTFLGVAATFGDDRALTNRVLRRWRVVFQSTAVSRTNVPESMRVFLRQQLRWKKSWLRESTYVARYFWRKNPLAALFTYSSILFPLISPLVVVHAVYLRFASGSTDGLWFYLIGTYAMALLYSLYYAFRRDTAVWHHGMSFVAVYMAVLVFQTYWGVFTMRDNRWGTRDSTVKHEPVDHSRITVLLPDVVPSVASVAAG